VRSSNPRLSPLPPSAHHENARREQDDNGWAGVGYNNPHLNTPTLDSLASDGLKLTSHYTYKYCAPTRGSFLTGRLPYRLASTRVNFIPWQLTDGTHLSYTMLPQRLKQAGYYSVHLGKWHQGLYTPEYTPIGRGFDYSFGFLEGGEDHNTSRTFGNACKRGEVDLSYGVPRAGAGPRQQPWPYVWPRCTRWQSLPGVALHSFYDPVSVDINHNNPYDRAFQNESSCAALCSNRLGCVGYSWRVDDPSHVYYHKCFLVSRDGGAHKPADAFRSAVCLERAESGVPPTCNSTLGAIGKNGTYTGLLFASEAVRVVEEHAKERPGTPLFLYYAMHDTHAPLEVPWRFAEPYARVWPDDEKRFTFSGMVSFVDEAVLNLTAALKRTEMWENSLFVWTNDNGSPIFVGGSNHPLRGGKGSNWEGGVRVATFVAGGLLPASMAGRTHDGLIHIADWLATFCAIAGIDPHAGEPEPVAPLDSLNAWPWISGERPTSSRTELVLDHRMFLNATTHRIQCHVINSTRTAGEACVSAALLRGGWKLVLGPEGQNDWFGWFSPNVSQPVNRSSPSVTNTACFPNACLFDMNASMTEHTDVAAERPDIVAQLMERVRELAEAYHPPVLNPPEDLDGYCAAVDANRNFVGPWMEVAPESIEDVGVVRA
jgi:arylsulfatase A-like enzyme